VSGVAGVTTLIGPQLVKTACGGGVTHVTRLGPTKAARCHEPGRDLITLGMVLILCTVTTLGTVTSLGTTITLGVEVTLNITRIYAAPAVTSLQC
jgi:hypothetical protein